MSAGERETWRERRAERKRNQPRYLFDGRGPIHVVGVQGQRPPERVRIQIRDTIRRAQARSGGLR